MVEEDQITQGSELLLQDVYISLPEPVQLLMLQDQQLQQEAEHIQTVEQILEVGIQ